MSKQVKKFIAQEFLILMLLVVFSAIGLLVLHSYNSYCNYKVKSYNNIISATKIKSDSLSEIHDRKLRNQKWFYKNISYRYNSYRGLTPSELWQKVNKVVNNGKFKVTYSNFTNEELRYHSSLGFNSYDDFVTFVHTNTLNESDLSNKSESQVLKNNLKKLRAKSIKANNSKVDITDFTKIIVITLFLILFVIRYLIYGVKWSIRTLQES